MNNRAAFNRSHFASLALLIAGAVFLVWPAPERTVPAIAHDDNGLTDQVNGLELRAEKAQTLFNLAGLPAVPAPEPPPPQPATVDPAAAIKRHRLVGVSVHEEGALALLTDGLTHFTVATGDTLAGFTITKISARRVDFAKEGVRATLALPDRNAP